MRFEGEPFGDRYSWRQNAENASEILYPGLLDRLREIQPTGDSAVINSILRANGIPTANYGEIAQLWLLSRIDERASEQMDDMVERGVCTPEDIAQVFFRMADIGLF